MLLCLRDTPTNHKIARPFQHTILKLNQEKLNNNVTLIMVRCLFVLFQRAGKQV